MSNDRLADSEWRAFIAKLEVAEEEFAQGRPAAFKALGPTLMTSPFAVVLVV